MKYGILCSYCWVFAIHNNKGWYNVIKGPFAEWHQQLATGNSPILLVCSEHVGMVSAIQAFKRKEGCFLRAISDLI